ncbi:MAG: hypothetical protein CHACPFDD_01296 [Phycisphaerae bacterium]|nr:hypothetical protein [Phycisphaerae bacterium]
MKNASLLLAAVSTMAAGTAAVASPPSWNRFVSDVAVTESRSAGKYDLHVAWGLTVDSILSTTNLGTMIRVDVNGETRGVVTRPVIVFSNAGFCGGGGGPCGTSCGNSTIDGLANDLFCDASECDCGPLGLTADFVGLDLKPGDEISVFLLPAAGAQPETSPGDDVLARTFNGDASFWDRLLKRVELRRRSNGHYDVIGTYQFASSNHPGPSDIRSQIMLFVNGSAFGPAYDACGDWLLAPGACGGICDSNCGTIYCDGSPRVIDCGYVENAAGLQFCACVSDEAQVVWSDLPLSAGDDVALLMTPAPGALPEISPMRFNDAVQTTVIVKAPQIGGDATEAVVRSVAQLKP